MTRTRARTALPRTFWRFFLPMLCVMAAAFVTASAVTYVKGLRVFRDIHARTAVALLAGTTSGMEHLHQDIDEFRRTRLQSFQTSLADRATQYRDICAIYRREALAGRMTAAQAREEALRSVALPPAPFARADLLVFEADDAGDWRLLASSLPASHISRSFLSKLDRALDDAGSVPVFEYATSAFSSPDSIRPALASAVRVAQWGWLVVSLAPLDVYKYEVADAQAKAARDYARYLQEISAGSGGELTVFGEQCDVMASTSPDPGSKEYLLDSGPWHARCREIIAAAARQTAPFVPAHGELPGDGAFPQSVFWTVRLPGGNQYAVFSMPSSRLAAQVSGFVDTLTVTGLTAVGVLGLALALLLANLLKPVNSLSNAYRRLKAGDFTVRADENLRGEIGDLCLQFNGMVRSLQELMQTEQLRQVELDEINRTLESQVRLRTEALANKASELEEANRRLQEMDTLKTNFLQNVSHELRTPLTAVLGFAKLIHKDFARHFAALAQGNPALSERGERILRNLSIIISEGERLTRLINDVLDLAKIESGRMDWQDDVFDLSGLLADVAATFQARAQDSGVALKLELPESLPAVRADKDRMTQVLINLLDNSFKFTSKGAVTLFATDAGGEVTVRVTDTGVGIPPEELDKVFDKFHQTMRRDTLRDKPPGTGLGLAICRQIVAHYGGELTAASTPGTGTTMTMTLPAARKSI
ncbi:integral membrane sensor signal transduction histidine kinase [Desulfovibrio sp. X2]|uniref:ATP-binding protein n=1 Tax=Desulfovibrio sp. X2 TaxID=941449 RepID=UPI000358E17D|nr:ATP-binding protein [Desulfovibrio sp. X2]EPR37467.1 integral membrane sensor signal transduction histidine kinase [Desulfovibrio sp. X2]